MKGLYGCICFIFLASISYGQTISSTQSGPWDQGSTWVGGVVPTSANSSLIDIQHNVSVPNGYSVTVDQVTVGIGATVTVDAGGTLTVGDEGTAATDFDIFNDGIDYGYLTVNGTLICNNSAIITGADQGNTNFNSGSIYRHLYTTTEGSIPIANWHSNSSVQIQGYTASINASAAGNWSQSFGNFVFECANLGAGVVQLNGLLTNVLTDLTVSSTGVTTGSVRFASTTNPTIVVGRDLVISGASRVIFNTSGTNTIISVGRDFSYNSSNATTTNSTGKTTINISRDFSMNAGGSIVLASGTGSGNGILNVVGNFNLTAGTLTETGSTGQGNINFTQSAVHTFTNTGTITNNINFSVSSLSTLDVGTSAITGAGSFTLNGTLRIGSTDGAGALQANTTAGNIQTPVATRTYSAGSTIVYNGTGAQFIGDGFPSGGEVNLTISNTNGVTLSTSLDIVALRTLNLASGNLIIGTQTLTINGTVTGSGGIIGGASSNLVIGGTGDFGVLTFNGTNELFNFTLDRTGSGLVTLGNNLAVLGTFTHTNGTLAIAGNTLTLSGVYGPSTPAPLSVTNASSIVVDGSGTLPTDVAFSGTDLGSLTLNRASSTFPTTSSLTIQNLNLLSGTFDNGSAIAIAAGGTITRQGGASGGSMTGNPTNTTNSYNVVYTDGALTSGPELPSNTTALANLSKTGSGILTLGSSITINGTLTLSSGSFNAGTNSIDLKGNFVSNAGSTLTSSAITFSGTTVVSGTATPIFGNMNITGTLTPSSTFQINGNLVNSGTLNAGSGTTIFGGTTTVSGTSVSSFANVTISGALTAPASFNVSGNWTNNGTFNSGAASNIVTFNGATTIGGSATTNFSGITISGTLNGPATLNVAGNFTNNGAFNAGTGTLVLNGGTAQSIGGSTTTNFYNITVSKASGTATISTAQNITNALTISGAGGLNANGMLTLISTVSGDARIAEITGGGSISGNVIAQRYLPNSAAVRAYRFLASPVTNATVSDWKVEFPITGTFNDPSTQAEWISIPGIKQNSPSMFIYNEAHTPTTTMNDRYESYPYNGTSSTSSPITNGRGYAAFVRQSAPITLNLSGTPQQGNVGVNVTAQSAGGNDGWNLIGNPYPAPINWENVNRPAAVNAQIALQDNTNNIGLGAGAYVYYTQGGIGIPASYTGTIASGQAFWVRATSNATIIFEENDKQAVSTPDFIREAPTRDILRVNIAGNNSQDEMVIHFSADASDGVDNNFDAFKLENSVINLSSFSADSVKMAINVLGSLSCNKEVGLMLENVTPGSYALNFSQFESFSSDLRIKLLDNFTGTTVDIAEIQVYDFTVSDDVNSYGKERFKLYFTYPAVNTALNAITNDVCLGSDASVTIEGTQNGIQYYPTINGSTVSDAVVSAGGTIQLTIPQDKLSIGENTIVLMTAVAGCGAVPLDNGVTIKTDKLYDVTGQLSGKSCGEGQITLSVGGAPSEGTYRWYETVDATTSIAGQFSSEFVTPVLNKTKTYFVSAVNSLGCEGPRAEVTAEIVYIENVAIAIQEDLLMSSYATGNQWFFNGEPVSGATGQSIEVTQTGVYEVEAMTASGCSTRASQEMIVMATEEPFGRGYNFYPNPVSDVLSIELPDTTPASGLVLNPLGKSIGELSFTTAGSKMSSQFYFRDQAPGLYLVKIYQGRKIIHQKIIKK